MREGACARAICQVARLGTATCAIPQVRKWASFGGRSLPNGVERAKPRYIMCSVARMMFSWPSADDVAGLRFSGRNGSVRVHIFRCAISSRRRHEWIRDSFLRSISPPFCGSLDRTLARSATPNVSSIPIPNLAHTLRRPAPAWRLTDRFDPLPQLARAWPSPVSSAGPLAAARSAPAPTLAPAATAEHVSAPAVTRSLVFVSSEVSPYSKSGGLADVVGSLPLALAQRGHRVMVISPRYDAYPNAHDTGCHPEIHGETVKFFHEVSARTTGWKMG